MVDLVYDWVKFFFLFGMVGMLNIKGVKRWKFGILVFGKISCAEE